MSGTRLPVTQGPRDRLRDEIKRERELTDRVLAAQRRLADEKGRREAVVAASDRRVAARVDDFSDALIVYIDSAGVRPERAATVLALPKSAITSMIRERRAALRRLKVNDDEGVV
jgi:hypothetical protein